MSSPTPPLAADTRRHDSLWLWLGPLAYMTLVGIYWVLRYRGLWSENDTAVLTQVIHNFSASGRLVPEDGPIYANGYSYQAISTYLMALTGIDAAKLQQILYPPLAVLAVLPALAAYRVLTGSARGAALATMVLFTQPEFLFVILRSSHEKFSRSLMLLCLFALARSFSLRHEPRLFALHVLVFYLLILPLIAINNLIAQSFILMIALALVLGMLLEPWLPPVHRIHGPLFRRLLYSSLICLGLLYLFTFYLYPPAQYILAVLEEAAGKIRELFFPSEPEEVTGVARYTGAYSYTLVSWLNMPVYLLLSSANWALLAASLAIWVRQGWRWLRRGEAPASSVAWLLWLLYGTLSILGALSVVADASGALGSNIQHRLFPTFSMLGAAVVGAALGRRRAIKPDLLGRVVLPFLIAVAAILAVLKATNEPALSNMWTFYHAEELVALRWCDSHLKDSPIWTDYNERLSTAYITTEGNSINRNSISYGWAAAATARTFVISNMVRLRGVRFGYPLPVRTDAQQIYDNGAAQVFRLRPETPFQR